MSKKNYIITLISLIIGIPLFEYAALNTMVSLKFETNELTDCISLASGVDLCKTIKICHLLAILCGLIFITLLVFKNRILNRIQKNEHDKK